MKKTTKAAESAATAGHRILLFGFICCLLLSLTALILTILPATYERLTAVSNIMSATCRLLVLTVLTGFIADILSSGKRNK